MRVERDFEDLLRSLNKHRVKYCIVGAFAVGFYARPRYSKDIDVLVDPTVENGRQIVGALKEFGFSNLNLRPEDFAKKDKIIQLGYEPVRADFMTSITGLSFNQVWKNKKSGFYGREKVFFIGKKELIKNKIASMRPQDKADLELLS